MKVSELIALLQTMPQDIDVVAMDDEGEHIEFDQVVYIPPEDYDAELTFPARVTLLERKILIQTLTKTE